MARSQKWTFLYALIITLIIFNFGIFVGYMLESSRINKINDWAFQAEMEILDQKIQENALDIIDFDCERLVQNNIDFADRIFEEAQKIDNYEKANRINKDIISQHKRYDLLRTLFWINSIKIKEKCNSDYHTVVYFYQYNKPSLDQKAKQRVFSKLLTEIKDAKGRDVMLIPIAADNGFPSINLLVEEYGVVELPTILIDEDIRLSELSSAEEIEKYLN
ncbi:MAG: hypothetical protein ABIJ14_00190 [Nanoarchaeota archaeon]|nr:hypothetical protein [Nanoarchaeota archaeon]